MEPGPHHHEGVSTEAADGPGSGSVLQEWPAPLGFSLKHNCSCILHHWKLQYNIKSVGLWTAAHVFLGTCETGTRAWHFGQKAGERPRQCWITSHRMSGILRCSSKSYYPNVSVTKLMWLSQREHLRAWVWVLKQKLLWGNRSQKSNQQKWRRGHIFKTISSIRWAVDLDQS